MKSKIEELEKILKAVNDNLTLDCEYQERALIAEALKLIEEIKNVQEKN